MSYARTVARLMYCNTSADELAHALHFSRRPSNSENFSKNEHKKFEGMMAKEV
jgi:hypothetical protein